MIKEDKVTLSRKRVELVESLAAPLPLEERVRIQGELSVVNAQLKALNTTEAAQLKAAADRRKVAGLAEAQANAVRARTKINGSLPVADSFAEEDDDLGQTAAIDGWIDAVLLRNDVDFSRNAKGAVMLSGPSPVPQKLAETIELLIAGLYAAARGQELPDLPPAHTEGRAANALKAKGPKAKPKKR